LIYLLTNGDFPVQRVTMFNFPYFLGVFFSIISPCFTSINDG